ncbi:hypothetical protein Salat_2995700 [Sesamum alatum]|uniref:Uncharacterized protein n=1 Tax=Sesamum alatum TaxID=300844 RepID=A0AAE2C7M2_9LAMI|nr:hypothetical protein Salat_2995700 [Sesamum alatum]
MTRLIDSLHGLDTASPRVAVASDSGIEPSPLYWNKSAAFDDYSLFFPHVVICYAFPAPRTRYPSIEWEVSRHSDSTAISDIGADGKDEHYDCIPSLPGWHRARSMPTPSDLQPP